MKKITYKLIKTQNGNGIISYRAKYKEWIFWYYVIESSYCCDFVQVWDNRDSAIRYLIKFANDIRARTYKIIEEETIEL